MFEVEIPIPPANLLILAHWWMVSKIPSMLSSFIARRKHEESCGLGVPALKRVGVAWVYFRVDMAS